MSEPSLPFLTPRAVDGKLALYQQDGTPWGEKTATSADFAALATTHPAPEGDAWLGVNYYVRLGDGKYPPKWAVSTVFGVDETAFRLPLGGQVAHALRLIGLEAGRRGVPFTPPVAKVPVDTSDESESD